MHMEMHKLDNDDDWLKNKDGSVTKIGSTGGDQTDYLYEYDFSGFGLDLKLIDFTSVEGLRFEANGQSVRTYGLRTETTITSNLQTGGLIDPSWDIMTSFVGGAVAAKGLGAGLKYISTSNKIGKLAFNNKYIGGTSKLFGRNYLGGHQGYLNRTYFRVGWSFNKGTHYLQPRIGPMRGAKHLNSWFTYKP